VEARSLLRWWPCEILGLREEPELSFVARDVEDGELFVIGVPGVEAVREAVERNGGGGEVIAGWEQAARLAPVLPGWTGRRAIVHLLGDSPRLPTVAPGAVRFLEAGELERIVLPAEPDDLRGELEQGAEHSPIAATMVEGRPVAFCYAGAITESLWDVAIDTLPEQRRRGYGSLCAAFMIEHMRTSGQEPVWDALEENPPSMLMARKLGFVPVDEQVIFTPREEEHARHPLFTAEP
jgi:GNAT superfamily N-acetyltransferase